MAAGHSDMLESESELASGISSSAAPLERAAAFALAFWLTKPATSGCTRQCDT